MNHSKSAKECLNNVVSVLGQAIADAYQVKVGRIKDTTLMFFDEDHRITINIAIKNFSDPVLKSIETFKPTPVEPEVPEEPEDPEDPEDPINPQEPEDPIVPEDPTEPETPEEPTEPEDPDDPEIPEEPEDPIEP